MKNGAKLSCRGKASLRQATFSCVVASNLHGVPALSSVAMTCFGYDSQEMVVPITMTMTMSRGPRSGRFVTVAAVFPPTAHHIEMARTLKAMVMNHWLIAALWCKANSGATQRTGVKHRL
ncbi:hypothetical protein L228DRAFT_147066 [Xylona heveae TC161]|uniref:Uncharacterized protein n=1 Tax=Xylona heveae (strain CBS 132557 / TC161) TaxID=1328760 RepID=A0A165GG48_XYLHT|nr:hypothetical protein L228DRAFT_147066 [Xylona heveae TC161]KZF22139.1 hypothetical protein L228DRAFT_147066 [Xylona heveae TC161]